MNLQELYNFVGRWFAVQLDKLKIRDTIWFVVFQGILSTLAIAIVSPTIDLPNWNFLTSINPLLTTDAIVGGMLTAIVAAIGPRTTALKNGEVELIGNKTEVANV